MSILTVENLNVNFGKNIVLKNVSFAIDEGDYLMILGPNGAGKSVLIKSILGINQYIGEVKIFDKTIDEVRAEIGYVPQYVTMDRSSPMTVRELVNLGIFDRKMMNKNKIVVQEIEKAGLIKKIDEMFGDLSGGQIKRALIARALVSKPKILFLDEPLAGVDMVGEQNMFDLLEKENKENKLTIVMISHDFNMVRKAATKVLCLNNEKLCFGSPDMINEESIEKTFGNGFGVHVH
jgi:ABC-type Mn2+/Zn2+ transport system ATPase subunit